VVMGHEIAHAIARHGNERMSQALAAQGLGNTLGAVMGVNRYLRVLLVLDTSLLRL